jgi:hypothetical protein
MKRSNLRISLCTSNIERAEILFREQWISISSFLFGLCSLIRLNIKCVVDGAVCRMDVFTFICFFFPVAYAFAIPCPNISAVLTLKTPLGTASGTRDAAGTYRFPVRYASANRWAPSTVPAMWALPYVLPRVFTLKTQWR